MVLHTRGRVGSRHPLREAPMTGCHRGFVVVGGPLPPPSPLGREPRFAREAARESGSHSFALLNIGIDLAVGTRRQRRLLSIAVGRNDLRTSFKQRQALQRSAPTEWLRAVHTFGQQSSRLSRACKAHLS